MVAKKGDYKDEVVPQIDGVNAGKREGIHKRDISLYNAIKHGGLNMKHVAEHVYAQNEVYNKKHVVRLYQKLYNFQDISDEELSMVRDAVSRIVKNLSDLLDNSAKMFDRKRKIKMILENASEEELEKLLKNKKDL